MAAIPDAGYPVLPADGHREYPVILNVPGLGSFNFPAIDPTSQYVAREADIGAENFGPFRIKSGTFSLYSGAVGSTLTGALSFVGTGTIFGKRASLGLADTLTVFWDGGTSPTDPYSVNVLGGTIRCALGQSITIELLPDMPTVVDHLDVHVVAGQQPELRVPATIGLTPVLLTGPLVQNQDHYILSAPYTGPLSELVPQLLGTVLDQFIFTGTIQYDSRKGPSFIGTIQARGGAPATLQPFPGKSMVFTDCVISYTSKIGAAMRFNGTFEGGTFTGLGQIDDVDPTDVKIIFDMNNWKISDLLPALHCQAFDQIVFDAQLTMSKREGFVLCGGPTNQTINLVGLNFSNIEVAIDTQAKSGYITGLTTILGIPIGGSFVLDWSISPVFAFMAEVNVPADFVWAPFAQITDQVFPGELLQLQFFNIRAGVETIYNTRGAGLFPTPPNLGKVVRNVIFKRYGKQALATVNNRVVSAMAAQSAKDGTPVKVNKKVPKPNPKVIQGQPIDVYVKNGLGLMVRRTLDPSLGGPGSTLDVFFEAQSRIMNVACDVSLRIGLFAGTFGVTLIASLPDGWKLSDSFPSIFTPQTLVTDALNLLDLSQGRFILSTRAGHIAGQPFAAGFNLMTKIVIDDSQTDNAIIKILKKAVDQSGTNPAGLTLNGSFNPLNPTAASLKIGLTSGNLGIAIPPVMFNSAAVNLALKGTPTLGIQGSFNMIPNEGADPLVFAADFMCSPVDVGVAFSMLNTWNNPFSIPGFSFGNMAILAKQTYTAIIEALASAGIAALIPSQVALTGEVAIGPSSGSATVSLGKNVSQLGFAIDIKNPPTLQAFVADLMTIIGVSSSDIAHWRDATSVIPTVRLTEVGLKLVPNTLIIGNVIINRGIGATFIADLLGFHVNGAFAFEPAGIQAEGSCDPIYIGPISITNFNQTAGPDVELLLDLTKGIRFKVDGRAEFAGIFEGAADINISTSGFAFELDSSIGPVGAGIAAHIVATSISFADPSQLAKLLRPEDLQLSFTFTNTLAQYVQNGVNNFLTQTKADIQQAMNDVIEQLARATALADIATQQAAVDYAYSQRISFFVNPILSIERELQWRFEQALLFALQIKYLIDQTPFGQFARKFLADLGLLPIIEDALAVFRDFGVLVVETGQVIFTDITSLITIENASWTGSLQDLENGIIPSLEVGVLLSGQVKEYSIGALNLRDPLSSIVSIATNLANIGVDVLKNSLAAPTRDYPRQRLLKNLEKRPHLRRFVAFLDNGETLDMDRLEYLALRSTREERFALAGITSEVPVSSSAQSSPTSNGSNVLDPGAMRSISPLIPLYGTTPAIGKTLMGIYALADTSDRTPTLTMVAALIKQGATCVSREIAYKAIFEAVAVLGIHAPDMPSSAAQALLADLTACIPLVGVDLTENQKRSGQAASQARADLLLVQAIQAAV